MRSIVKRLFRRHTTVVAYLALFAALGGSAYAAVTVTGKNIKDGTVTGRDVKNRSLGSKDIAQDAVKSKHIKNNSLRGADVNEASLGQVPSAARADRADRATNVYAANVDGNGTLLGSVPDGVTSSRVGTGIYRVDFPKAVSGCLIFSAFGSNDGAINPGSTGVIPATVENPNRVAVATFNNAGALEDRDFYVQMTCP
jgi:hypothetical protein